MKTWVQAEGENTELWQACKAAAEKLMRLTTEMGARSNYHPTEEVRGFAATIYDAVASIPCERYTFLKENAFLQDLYDVSYRQRSSWDWTIRLETGKSKGPFAPIDTPDFEETVDMYMKKEGKL